MLLRAPVKRGAVIKWSQIGVQNRVFSKNICAFVKDKCQVKIKSYLDGTFIIS